MAKPPSSSWKPSTTSRTILFQNDTGMMPNNEYLDSTVPCRVVHGQPAAVRRVRNPMQPVEWAGPYKLETLLRRSSETDFELPPADPSVNIITKSGWTATPSTESTPLYVGRITGQSERFRTRVGQLVAHMCGLFVDGKHSGGESLHAYCRQKELDPLGLYIAWARRCVCSKSPGVTSGP